MLKVCCLGAGQDVGRSCIVLSIGGKNVILDCGMHMGYEDARRFPDFSYISQTDQFTDVIDAVIISHFHLDHCGALPYFSEVLGYNGPIYMTHPTRAICPILLEDFRKIAVERRGESNFFTSQNIRDCMNKVIAMNVKERVMVDETLEITAYYAGHVLGAAMFEIRVGQHSVVYTGDYNMTPDRHLGSAWIDKVRPDLLITESTYCTFIRDSKRVREKEFLARVHSTVEKGGKVLIPVFALGRVQELCILIETYWQRMNLQVPVYYTAGLASRATDYYKMYIQWTNQKIKDSFAERNMFEFEHIKPFEPAFANNPGPMVLFATPGMLHAGTSLEVFKKWAGNPLNMVIIPGYCSVGTVGAMLLAGKHKQQRIEVDKKTYLDVRCSVEYLSFSAHADAPGIEELIRMCEPKNVMLVHGEKNRIAEFKRKVVQDFGIPCFDPPNGTTVTIQVPNMLQAEVDVALVQKKKRDRAADYFKETEMKKLRPPQETIVVDSIIQKQRNDDTVRLSVPANDTQNHELFNQVEMQCKNVSSVLHKIQQTLQDELDLQCALIGNQGLHVKTLSLEVHIGQEKVTMSWTHKDNEIAWFVQKRFF